MKKLIALLACLALVLGVVVISAKGASAEATAGQATASDGQTAGSTTGPATDSREADAEYAEGVVEIEFGATVSISGEGASVRGDTLSITAAGVYTLTGSWKGQVDVDAKGKVYLEFDGVDIRGASGPALSISDAKKVTITLVEGTISSLADSQGDSNDTAALLTNDTLVINGKGALTVTGNNNEAISSDDDLIINSGTIKVTAVDDGLNAHDDITINGGDVSILAGGDGLDSNDTIHINGGSLVAFGGTTEGEGGIDALGAFTIAGGTVVAGGNAIAPVSVGSKQGTLYLTSATVRPAGTAFRVMGEDEELLAFAPEVAYLNVLLSSDDLVGGATYQAYSGTEAGPTIVAAR